MITIKELMEKAQTNYVKAGEGTFKCALSKIENGKSKAGKPTVILTFKVLSQKLHYKRYGITTTMLILLTMFITILIIIIMRTSITNCFIKSRSFRL